jgi:hypothetical protein
MNAQMGNVILSISTEFSAVPYIMFKWIVSMCDIHEQCLRRDKTLRTNVVIFWIWPEPKYMLEL